MKKRIVALLAVAALALTGCAAGNTGGQAAPAPSETGQASAAETRAAAETSEQTGLPETAESSLTDEQAAALAKELAGYGMIVNEPLTDTEKELLNGGSLSTEDYRGKALILNFMASWCGYCVEEYPYFKEVLASYGEEAPAELVFITGESNLQSGEIKDKIRAQMAEAGLEAPVMLDYNGEYSSKMNLTGAVPYSLFVDAEGTVLVAWRGAFLNAETMRWITDMVVYHPELLKEQAGE